MAETSPKQTLKLPLWFINLCHWFWNKKGRVAGVISSVIGAFLLWFIEQVLTTTEANRKTLPLQRIIDTLSRNWPLYILVLFVVLIILGLFTLILYISNQIPEELLPLTWQEQQNKKAKQQSEQDGKQVYLRWLSNKVSLLPRLGLGADLITPQSVDLTDIFIPLELQASPKALRLQPLDPDELKRVSGLDLQHQDYLVIDQKGEWERKLLIGERIPIQILWENLSQRQPVAVIQGAPGMGKSTLLARITLSLALQGQGKKDPQLPLTPIAVPVLILIKEYADYLQQLPQSQDRSLMTFLLHMLEKELINQGVDQPKNVAEQIKESLKASQCLVMFDGLDEVSDKSLQQEIQQTIHNFIEQQRRPSEQTARWNRFLITSRIAEYNAPALESYRYFLVAELSKEQISDFLPRWYQTSTQGIEEKEKVRIKQLIAEMLEAYENNEAVHKLASNPLLLTLMAIMLNNGTRLPERRIELYQAVVKTLLESRNEIKGLQKLYEDEAIQYLGKLAFTMQGVGNNLAHRSDVEKALREVLFVQGGSTEAREQAIEERKVQEYITSFSKRGGLFIERTSDYYGFIHRSFQEYFAARYMLREIENDRDKKINEYTQLVHTNPNAWREPFILATAFKSDRDGGPLASKMLYSLLSSRGKNALRDLLLVATCIAESKYINLEAKLQQEAVEKLFSQYEQAQKGQRFDDCRAIEEVIRDWLLVLREGETYLELPHKIQSVIANGAQPERQRAALTLFCMITTQLQVMRYNLFPLLIPSLLAISGLDTVTSQVPASNITTTTGMDIADLSLTLLSLMGKRGPAGLLLEQTQNYFKMHPQLLRDLAHYSLESGTLITPVSVPVENEAFTQYSGTIARWIKLRDSYKQTRITERNREDCLAIHQELLDNAQEVRYPTTLYLQEMLQRATNTPTNWQESWQAYLLERLENTPYLHYQQSTLLWTILFPQKSALKILAEHIINHYKGPRLPLKDYGYRFLSVISRNSRDLRNLNELRDLMVLRDLIHLIDLRDLRDLRDLSYLMSLRDLIDLGELSYLKDLIYLKSLRELKSLSELRELSYSTELRELREMLLTENVTEISRKEMFSQSHMYTIEQLDILMGRILQIRENNKIGPKIEVEIQRLAAAALDSIASGNVQTTIYEAALDVLRSLPARTANEIAFVLQSIQRTTEPRVLAAYMQSLIVAKPVDAAAWKELEKGKTSQVKEVREAVERMLGRHK